MPRNLAYLCLAASLLIPGCSNRRTTTEPLRVLGALPQSASAQSGLGTRANPEPLWLNSKVVVAFSDDIDSLSVTADTVRMVKVTPEGPQTVKMARRHVGTKSVGLIPEWPISPSLDDGSFVPGQLYRLEVAGFPLTNTVYSRTGAPVRVPFQRYFRAVTSDATDPGPLLPVGLPSDPFELSDRKLRMASKIRTVQLHFTMPVDPTSVSPRSFRFWFYQGQDFPIESTRVLTVRRPIYRPAETPGGVQTMEWSFPGSTVELRLAPGYELGATVFVVDLKPAGQEQYWVRDYRRRTVTPTRNLVGGHVFRGSKIELIDVLAVDDEPFERVDPNRLSFESRTRNGRMQPLARREFGRGALGAFRPKNDVTLQLGVPFEGENGGIVIAQRRFEFTEIRIPKGVTVTLKGTRKVDLVAFGDIRIDGTLVLETVHALKHGKFESAATDSYLRGVIETEFGCRLATAANLIVNGEIRHRWPDETKGSPLVLLGRTLSLHGTFPGGSVLAQEPGRIPAGTAQHGHQVAYATKPGYPEGHRIAAAAWTRWIKLPKEFVGGRINARALDSRGAIDAYIQLASPDPIDPTRPYIDPAGMPEERKLPLKQGVEVPDRVFVRFQLRAKVIGGRELPSVRGLVVFRD